MTRRHGPLPWTFGLGRQVLDHRHAHQWRTSAHWRVRFPAYSRAHVLRVLHQLHRDGHLERRGDPCHYEYRKAQP